MGWRGRWEGGSGWGTHVNPWLIHVNVWQKPLQYCKVVSLQLIKIIGGKKNLQLASKKLKKEKMDDSLWVLWDNIKCTNIHVIGRDEREVGQKCVW